MEYPRKLLTIICFKLGFFFFFFFFPQILITHLFRLGKKFGFDFNENKDEKIGKLRTFVKENRNKADI